MQDPFLFKQQPTLKWVLLLLFTESSITWTIDRKKSWSNKIRVSRKNVCYPIVKSICIWHLWLQTRIKIFFNVQKSTMIASSLVLLAAVFDTPSPETGTRPQSKIWIHKDLVSRISIVATKMFSLLLENHQNKFNVNCQCTK